ncbi:hypothetical protein BJ085DRAFT_34309 [Dimargaris cristalligena]|uniref:Uncharacterized protein n=1 Tax=Dimargaris cristalligena TaxID=215637 RepID=A0A4Q0A4B3_9FUNG|nr:hypothetical protein BJ085DRAFT_34309 [Dimargaris cristalligena]|eukprot:RKP40100.1 hypothetical protein BJ085DRAFT_34309 [Dimargaris cristalligena]
MASLTARHSSPDTTTVPPPERLPGRDLLLWLFHPSHSLGRQIQFRLAATCRALHSLVSSHYEPIVPDVPNLSHDCRLARFIRRYRPRIRYLSFDLMESQAPDWFDGVPSLFNQAAQLYCVEFFLNQLARWPKAASCLAKLPPPLQKLTVFLAAAKECSVQDYQALAKTYFSDALYRRLG